MTLNEKTESVTTAPASPSTLSAVESKGSASTAPSSLGVAPVPYLTDGIEAYSVHRDFDGAGNVLVLCPDGDARTGFRVSGFHLSAASPIFQTALVGHLHSPCTLHLPDAADDVAAFLRLFKLAPSAAWAAKAFDPPLATYYRVLVVLEKYQCHEFLRAAFGARVASSARYSDGGVGWEPFYLLLMAHRLRSPAIWAAVLPRLAKWRVDPATMTPEQVAVLGPELYRIVVAISALSGGARAFQDVKGVSVTYKDGLAVVCGP
ncbi:hypothetical protein Q8F55_008886 [Vanrija albida]|uniref:BTB domain-containing protein n=1 Tax=Vanrija albida TaxID=181172 RepID=A0ABR3PSA5_9TREE